MHIRSVITTAKAAWAALLAVTAMSAAPAGAAVSFYISPVGQVVGVGGTGTFELRAAITGGSPGAIGDYDINIAYNDAIVQIDSMAFGTGLDVPGFPSDTFFSAFGGGNIRVFEVSFVDDPGDLVAWQPEDFRLALIGFTGLTPGTSPLTISVAGASDEAGFAISPNVISSVDGSITVRDGVNTVPETLGVVPAGVAFGLLLIIGARLGRKSRGAPAAHA